MNELWLLLSCVAVILVLVIFIVSLVMNRAALLGDLDAERTRRVSAELERDEERRRRTAAEDRANELEAAMIIPWATPEARSEAVIDSGYDPAGELEEVTS